MSVVPESVKALVLHRDGTCVRCGSGWSLNYHHRRLRSQSPKQVVHNVENLILLCGSGTTGCHGFVHANPEVSRRMGWIVPSHANPLDWPVYLPWEGKAHFLTADGGREIDKSFWKEL